jgi:hypothetical protein
MIIPILVSRVHRERSSLFEPTLAMTQNRMIGILT